MLSNKFIIAVVAIEMVTSLLLSATGAVSTIESTNMRIQNASTHPQSLTGPYGNWSQVSATPYLAPRVGPSLIFDATDNYTLLFGGDGFNDTWTFRGGIWTNLTPSLKTSPSPRSYASIVYDPVDGYVLLFGGVPYGRGGLATLNDTWEFQHGAWTNLTNYGDAPLGGQVSMTYDIADGFVLLFGGGLDENIASNQTWEFHLGTWTRLADGPYGANSASMVFDQKDGYVVLIGGESPATFCFNITWKFIGRIWAEIPVTKSPECFYGAGLAYDPTLGSLVYYGGTDTTLGWNTTWTFSGGYWTRWTVSVNPGTQMNPGMAFDYADNYLLLVGQSTNSTWRFPAPPLHSPPTYAVTLSENDLPLGTTWFVTLNGTTQTGTGNLVFTEPNGTYSFSVGAIAGYSASPSSGAIHVNGTAVSQSIAFTALSAGQYSLIFSESGLPTGTNWSVIVGTTTYSSTGSTISFAETNGTYHYTVGKVTGYTSSPSPGNVTVNGSSKTAVITFTKSGTEITYTVIFTENGLPPGTSWVVTLNGTTVSSTTTTITFQEANGSYGFTVGSVSGYTVSPSSGSIKVNGAAASQSVAFTHTSPKPGLFGLSGNTGYIVIGLVVAIVAAATVAVFLMRRKPGQGDPAKSEETDSKPSPEPEKSSPEEPPKASGEEAISKG